jgi:hypothetical protein
MNAIERNKLEYQLLQTMGELQAVELKMIQTNQKSLERLAKDLRETSEAASNRINMLILPQFKAIEMAYLLESRRALARQAEKVNMDLITQEIIAERLKKDKEND